MSRAYEELDVRASELGQLILRRRRPPGFDVDIYEITLDDDLLMSSYLNESELQLVHLAIPEVGEHEFDVLVGGLGLGYTASAALGYPHVRSVTVVELLPEVVAWHRDGRVPLGPVLTADPRCTMRQGDFFTLAGGSERPAWHPPGGYGAILVDIDHAPDQWLDHAHGRFYESSALRRAAALLEPGGVFAFWSAGPCQDDFVRLLAAVFPEVRTHAIEVFNPMIDADQVDTVYLARP